MTYITIVCYVHVIDGGNSKKSSLFLLHSLWLLCSNSQFIPNNSHKLHKLYSMANFQLLQPYIKSIIHFGLKVKMIIIISCASSQLHYYTNALLVNGIILQKQLACFL